MSALLSPTELGRILRQKAREDPHLVKSRLKDFFKKENMKGFDYPNPQEDPTDVWIKERVLSPSGYFQEAYRAHFGIKPFVARNQSGFFFLVPSREDVGKLKILAEGDVEERKLLPDLRTVGFLEERPV